MKRRKSKNVRNPSWMLTSNVLFQSLVGLVGLALLISLGLCSYFVGYLHLEDRHPHHPHHPRGLTPTKSTAYSESSNNNNKNKSPHLHPRLPHLPAFPTIPNETELIHQTLYENKPTLAGMAAVLYRFLDALHHSNQQLASSNHHPVEKVRATYFRLVEEYLMPLERAYYFVNNNNTPPFPIRTDDSIFVSVAAFREYLLADTLESLFANAANPNQLFVGVIVNNCFDGHNNCKGGVKVVGKDKMGKDKLQKVDGVPDVNQIETFCNDHTFKKYCDNGQVRVLYVHEQDALGPAVARYYSSKLWGGETYYVQIDSHLHFATHWDELYIQDLKLAKSYPKAILSTYPPGFVNFRQDPPFTPGTRLCKCQMRRAEDFLPRVEMEGRNPPNQSRPTQMAFVGAGFFFARAELFMSGIMPLDPFLPWMFMGEEIALSIRAWTHGWNMYAPRKNLIGHQYRPIQFGTPHYWESVARLFGHTTPNLVDHATTQIRQRIQYMMGYPNVNVDDIIISSRRNSSNITVYHNVLLELEHYGLGKERSGEDYLKFAEIDLEQKTCGSMIWCSEGSLE